MRTLNMFINSALDNIPLIGTCLLAVCRSHTELQEKQIFEIWLAVIEWLNNIIEHGYKHRDDHGIWIELELETAWLAVIITDRGEELPVRVQRNIKEFRHAAEPPADFSDESGRGLYVAVKSMDKFIYRREEGKNIVQMTKFYNLTEQKVKN